jgi:hypothetical protein
MIDDTLVDLRPRWADTYFSMSLAVERSSPAGAKAPKSELGTTKPG